MPRPRFRKRYIQASLVPEVNLVPLIDTALTLLVIFMIATPMLHSINVSLPRGATDRHKTKVHNNLVISIDKDKNIYCNGTLTKLETLSAQMSAETVLNAQQTAIVKADQSVNYGFVVEVVSHIEGLKGIQHVALAMEKKA